MRFELTQHFATDPDTVLEAYLNESMWSSLDGFSRVGEPTWIGIERNGATATTRVHYQFIANLPSAATAIVNPNKLAWVQVTVWDTDARSGAIRFEPDAYADKLSFSANESLHTDESGGTVRTIKGELKVRVLLVGGRVESAILDGLVEYLREEAEKVEAWIESR